MKIVFSISALALILAMAAPANAADPKGLWLTAEGDAKIRIVDCGGALCGTIAWLKQEFDTDTGKPPLDKQNPDASKRKRPLLGIMILLGMRPNGPDKWSGSIYNADDGNIYQGNIAPVGATTLKVEGCALGTCQAETWTRAK
jgi:uncharacterized protein (DUF2147 family)